MYNIATSLSGSTKKPQLAGRVAANSTNPPTLPFFSYPRKFMHRQRIISLSSVGSDTSASADRYRRRKNQSSETKKCKRPKLMSGDSPVPHSEKEESARIVPTDASARAIAKAHEDAITAKDKRDDGDESAVVNASGRAYPRPTTVCFECHGSLVCCWGKEIAPYWRHLTNAGSCSGHKNHGETYTHRLAKHLLVEYMVKKKGTVIGVANCPQCLERAYMRFGIGQQTTGFPVSFASEVTYIDTEPSERLTYNGTKWTVAATPSNERVTFDVGGKSASGKVVCGIEVCKTHRTEERSPRENVPWIEVAADEVVSALDVEEVPSELFVTNMRIPTRCDGPNCVPDSVLAERLGYLVTNNKNGERARILVSKALHGSHVSDKRWILRPSGNVFDPRLRPTWSQVAARGRCLRCRCSFFVREGRPYCIGCWKLLTAHGTSPADTEIIKCSQTEMSETWGRIFEIMRDLPGNPQPGDACHFCGKTPQELSSSRSSGGSDCFATWTDGMRKRVCYSCLDKEFEKRGVYDKKEEKEIPSPAI